MANNRIRFSNDFILKDEKVGINTTEPRALLDVGGDLYVSGVSTFNDAYISGNLGIGSTNPQYKLDVNGDSQIAGTLYVKNVITTGTESEEIVRNTSGIITTNSLSPIAIDSIEINTYRSAKYLVQITSKNSIPVGYSGIGTITGGSNYFPGVYNNVPLEALSGNGFDATAQITVSPQVTRQLVSSSSGIFTVDQNTSGIVEGQTIFFNNDLTILPLEQSKLTGIQLISSGFGYTSIPNITAQSPIILNNPVEGVGTGVTATINVDSMSVYGAVITSGITTTIIPTVQFSTPSNGITATGVVGVGVSSITVANVGSGYTVSPQISIPKVTGFASTVGMGISSLNWQVTSGSNYTSPTITVNAIGGIGTGAVVEADVDTNSPNGLINFRVTNPGTGYTTIPEVIINDSTGVGATVTITTLTVSNVTVNNIGSGATTPITTSDIVLTPVNGIGSGATLEVNQIVPTNVIMSNVGSGYTSSDIPVSVTFSNTSIIAEESLGVEAISISSSGIGYTTLPSLIFDSPTISGLGSTATASSTKLGYDEIVLYGTPSAAYYIKPLTSTTFSVSLSSGGTIIPLGYSIPTNTTVSIGGTVSEINVTYSGSNYALGDILTATNFDSSRIDTNVGVGFSFELIKTINNFQISDLLLLQTAESGNPFAYISENSSIADIENLGYFSADVVDENARLIFTPTFAINEIKYYRTAFVI